MGSLRMEIGDTVNVRCPKTGLSATINFKLRVRSLHVSMQQQHVEDV